MNEQFKRVSNPLTIIAIFAGLAEVAGTVAIKLVNDELQSVFVWFVMGFPVLLVVLFFVTLNFNRTALYAPSDFRDDESFLSVLAKKQKLSIDLETIGERLAEVQERIISEAELKVGTAGQKEREAIIRVINQQLSRIKDQVTDAKESAEGLTLDLSNARLPQSALQSKILATLNAESQQISLTSLAKQVGSSEKATQRAADRLVERGLLQAVVRDGATRYGGVAKTG